jgi:hypothetical protein
MQIFKNNIYILQIQILQIITFATTAALLVETCAIKQALLKRKKKEVKPNMNGAQKIENTETNESKSPRPTPI